MPRKDAFRRASEVYLEEVAQTRSPATLKCYSEIVRRLARDVRAARVSTYISRWSEEDLLRVLARRGHRLPNTQIVEMTVLRRMLAHSGVMVMERAIRTRRVRIPRPSRVNVRWYNEAALGDARAACRSDAEYVVIVLASELGLRRCEIAGLRLSDVAGDVLLIRGKGGDSKHVPLTASVARTLDAWMVARRAMVVMALVRDPMAHVPEEVLIHRRGSRLAGYTPDGLTDMVASVGRRAGIRLSPHDCRRSCGREIYKVTGDLLAVNSLLRHKSVDQTRDYIGANLEDARRAMEARERKRASTAPVIMEPAYQVE